MCSFFSWFSEVNHKDDGEEDEDVFLEIQDEVMSLSCLNYFNEIFIYPFYIFVDKV